jgi:long-chain acyl-CoA synthetase
VEGCVSWAEEKGLKYSTYEELIALPETRELIQGEIDRLSGNLARYETIKKFIFAKEPFTIDTGELTPSLKVKRNVVEKNYKEEIDAMYTD